MIPDRLSARRNEEILSLRDDSLFIDGEGLPWLRSWIVKVRRHFADIPVPMAVVKAIEVLTWLSEIARNADDTRWLFHFAGVNDKVHFEFGAALRHFATVIDVPTLPDGTSWEFAPHQFRRFFAIVYYHRFQFPHLTALTLFLDHYDPEMTRRYVEEDIIGGLLHLEDEAAVEAKSLRLSRAARGADFKAGALDALIDRLTAVAKGETWIGGRGGETINSSLQELVDQARNTVAIDAAGDEEDAFNTLLYAWASAGKMLEPNGQGHSLCKCTGSRLDLAAAGCLNEMEAAAGAKARNLATRPNMIFAQAIVCAECAHNVQAPEFEMTWRSSLAELETEATLGATELQRAAATRRAEVHRRLLARAYGTPRYLIRPLETKR